MSFSSRYAFSRAILDTLRQVNCQDATTYQESENVALYHAAVNGLTPDQTAELVRIAQHTQFDFHGGTPPLA